MIGKEKEKLRKQSIHQLRGSRHIGLKNRETRGKRTISEDLEDDKPTPAPDQDLESNSLMGSVCQGQLGAL